MRVVPLRTLALATALVGTGCSETHGTVGDDAGRDAPASGRYAGAYVMNECGPADGAANRLILWAFPVPECSADPAQPSLDFYLHGDFLPITAGETITVTPPSSGLGGGRATACPGGTPPCRTSQDFTLTFATFEADVGARGTYEVRFADGTSESGSFDATWCQAFPPLCG
jgi:hypothetical protein